MLIRVAMSKEDWEEVARVVDKHLKAQDSDKTSFKNPGQANRLNRALNTIRKMLQEQTATLEKPRDTSEN
jgi:transcriptional regulator of heat shock response